MLGFPGGSDGKEAACNTGDPGSIPGLGRSSGEGNGHPFQYSGYWIEKPSRRLPWIEKSMVAKIQTRLSEITHTWVLKYYRM